MKTRTMSSGVTLTLSKTELQALLNLARYGQERLAESTAVYLDRRQEAVSDDVIVGLELALGTLRHKQAEAKARRDAPKREEERRRAREHHAHIDGWNVIGTLGDWIDNSADPDHRLWVDLHNPTIEHREQAEVRRNVWRVYLTRRKLYSTEFEMITGSVTETANRDEIEPLVRALIERETARSIAA